MLKVKKTKKKERTKSKRKKLAEKNIPKLSILNIEQEGELVECALEIGKHSITFKFNLEDDQPEDIAKMLVSSSFSSLKNPFLNTNKSLHGTS